MQPVPLWMLRENPGYDPNLIGSISHARVFSALVGAGKVVLVLPLHVRPYDLVIEERGKFFRVQCKTGRLFRGAVCFRPHRLRAARRETGRQRRVTGYGGEIDYFGVYCPETDAVYLVPIEDVNTTRVCTLRVTPAKNNQRKKVRWAKDYVLAPLQVPDLLNGERVLQ